MTILTPSWNSDDENYVPKSHGVNFLGSRLKIGGVKVEATFDKFKGGFCLGYDEFWWVDFGSLFDIMDSSNRYFFSLFLKYWICHFKRFDILSGVLGERSRKWSQKWHILVQCCRVYMEHAPNLTDLTTHILLPWVHSKSPVSPSLPPPLSILFSLYFLLCKFYNKCGARTGSFWKF